MKNYLFYTVCSILLFLGGCSEVEQKAEGAKAETGKSVFSDIGKIVTIAGPVQRNADVKLKIAGSVMMVYVGGDQNTVRVFDTTSYNECLNTWKLREQKLVDMTLVNENEIYILGGIDPQNRKLTKLDKNSKPVWEKDAFGASGLFSKEGRLFTVIKDDAEWTLDEISAMDGSVIRSSAASGTGAMLVTAENNILFYAAEKNEQNKGWTLMDPLSNEKKMVSRAESSIVPLAFSHDHFIYDVFVWYNGFSFSAYDSLGKKRSTFGIQNIVSGDSLISIDGWDNEESGEFKTVYTYSPGKMHFTKLELALPSDGIKNKISYILDKSLQKNTFLLVGMSETDKGEYVSYSKNGELVERKKGNFYPAVYPTSPANWYWNEGIYIPVLENDQVEIYRIGVTPD